MQNITKKLTFSALVTLILFSLVLIPQASAQPAPVEQTIVNGQVKDGANNPVSGASVQTNCNGNVRNTSTNGDGKYQTVYTGTECPVNTVVTAQATAGSQSGGGSGQVQEVINTGTVIINVALINIAVPEFGLMTGAVAAVGSLAVFLKMRKKTV
ncbi:MAG: hypothetical protein WC775_02205 [Patescibacteria group bacterium]